MTPLDDEDVEEEAEEEVLRVINEVTKGLLAPLLPEKQAELKSQRCFLAFQESWTRRQPFPKMQRSPLLKSRKRKMTKLSRKCKGDFKRCKAKMMDPNQSPRFHFVSNFNSVSFVFAFVYVIKRKRKKKKRQRLLHFRFSVLPRIGHPCHFISVLSVCESVHHEADSSRSLPDPASG